MAQSYISYSTSAFPTRPQLQSLMRGIFFFNLHTTMIFSFHYLSPPLSTLENVEKEIPISLSLSVLHKESAGKCAHPNERQETSSSSFPPVHLPIRPYPRVPVCQRRPVQHATICMFHVSCLDCNVTTHEDVTVTCRDRKVSRGKKKYAPRGGGTTGVSFSFKTSFSK